MRKINLFIAALLIPFAAQAVTMTFEGVAPPGGTTIPVAPYTEVGFTINASGGDNGIFSQTFGGNPGGFTSDYFTYNGPSTEIKLSGGGAFTLNSLDLGLGASNSNGDSAIDVTLIGSLMGGGSVSTTYLSVLTATTRTLNWANLTSVKISGTDDPGIDNIVLNERVGVPESGSTLALLGLALVGCGLFKRCRG